MLAHSSSTWPFPLPLWVHKSSIIFYMYVYYIYFYNFLHILHFVSQVPRRFVLSHSSLWLQSATNKCAVSVGWTRCPSKPPGGQSIRKVNFCCGTTSASPCQPRNGSKLIGSQQTTKTYTTWFKTYKIQNQNDYCEDKKDLQYRCLGTFDTFRSYPLPYDLGHIHASLLGWESH